MREHGRLRVALIAVVGSSLCLFGLYAYGTVRAVGAEYRGLRRVGRVVLSLIGSAALLVLALAITFPMFVATCYEQARFRRRTPELTREYVSLITKYRQRGVISESVYNKIVVAMRKEDAR